MSQHTHGSTDGERDYVRVTSGDSHVHLHASDSVTFDTRSSRKICCVCGEDVTGKPRMKDSAGTYWCYECGMADQQQKQASLAGATAVHAATRPTCAECAQEMSADKLTDYSGRRLCAPCIEKIERAVRREASRLAAAEQEALRMTRNHRLLMLVLTAGVLAAIAFAIARLL